MNDLRQQFYEMLMESQYWSAAQLVDYQRSQLEQLLRHARKNVPFYENRLDPVFRPDGSIDWDRWGELPIVRRADLYEHKEAMRAKELPSGHGAVRPVRSSGSTGTPIEVLTTHLDRMTTDVARWRSMTWRDVDFSQVLCIRHGEARDIVPPHGVPSGVWGPPWLAAAQSGRSFTMPRWWSVPDQLDFLVGTGAAYSAIGGPKTAHILAIEAARRGIEHQLSSFFVNGEKTNEEDRNIVRRTFGAEIVELYSSKEGGHIAHPCPSGMGLHVNDERVVVELIGEDGRPVEPGKPGRVVITPLYSTAMPLIRYDQGDLARLGTGCSCGRTLTHLTSIDGRVTHMFRHPDGRRMSRGFPEHFRPMLGASMWQFAQVGPLDFEIRYVPVDLEQVGDESAVARGFREWYFDDARIVFRRLDAIPLTASGKYMEYVYEVVEPRVN